MGFGYMFACKNCRKRYTVQFGIGRLFPKVYKEIVAAIEAGEHGEEWQKLYRETPYAAVDGAWGMFLCDSCGNWENAHDLSLYEPNNPVQIRKKKYGEKTVEELGYIPLVLSFDLEQDYHLLKEYTHVCNKCGKNMRKIGKDDVPDILPCPKCGTENEKKPDIMMWD